jgi:hypothetical protein
MGPGQGAAGEVLQRLSDQLAVRAIVLHPLGDRISEQLGGFLESVVPWAERQPGEES